MEEKKKRGCNYTAAEKAIFLELIKKYQNIIENKETNAKMILKKREAWDSVCQQYNTVAASGFRTWQQLRHLYENLKQRSKKNFAKINKDTYCMGGGTYKNSLTGQVESISNLNEDAALCFGDRDSNNKRESEDEASPELIIINTDNIDDEDAQMAEISMEENCKPCTITSNIADQVKHRQKASLMQQYLKAKLKNAKLENKYLINKNKMEVNKYKIQMQILKLKLKKLKSPNNN